MRHFVSYFNDSVKKHWDLPAVTNFGKETYTYAQMAEEIEKYHILFEKTGIKKGDKVALYARNSAEWCIAYFATLTYDAITVPFQMNRAVGGMDYSSFQLKIKTIQSSRYLGAIPYTVRAEESIDGSSALTFTIPSAIADALNVG